MRPLRRKKMLSPLKHFTAVSPQLDQQACSKSRHIDMTAAYRPARTPVLLPEVSENGSVWLGSMCVCVCVDQALPSGSALFLSLPMSV